MLKKASFAGRAAPLARLALALACCFLLPGAAICADTAEGGATAAPARQEAPPAAAPAAEPGPDAGSREAPEPPRTVLKIKVRPIPRAASHPAETGAKSLPQGLFTEQVCFQNDANAAPIDYYPYVLELEGGVFITGRTDEDGCTARLYTPSAKDINIYDGEEAILREGILTGDIESPASAEFRSPE